MTERDKQRLVGVHPTLVAKLGPVLDRLGMFVIVGVRTVEQQQADFAKGRSEPGHVVTMCDGVKMLSRHQKQADGYGHAVDCGFTGPHPFAGDFHAFGVACEAAGLVWGGRFHAPIDLDHVELK